MTEPPNVDSHVVLSVRQMSAADAMTIQQGISGFDLLSVAGRRVYETVWRYSHQSDCILVACGTGNNGGDGLIAAKLLLDDGFDVCIALLGTSESVHGDAKQALTQLGHPVVSLFETRPEKFSVIIDALLGTGLDRPISGKLAQWIRYTNGSGATIFSVDVPTGINGDTGAVMGDAITAEHTVTFFRKKPGHLLFPGRQHCGEVHVEQIGIEESVLDALNPRVVENNRNLWCHAIPESDWGLHKYTKGHAVVVTGNATSTGAARLAAHAALRAGAGLVTLACPRAAASTVAAHVTCEMIELVDTADEFRNMLSDARITSVVLGPGMGVGSFTKEMVEVALGSSVSVVLDADALTSFAECLDNLISFIANAKKEVVLTPHEGEFKRLFPSLIGSPGASSSVVSKLDLAQQAAMQTGATIVLKGGDTVIAEPNGYCALNSNAPAWLATAGSGDVLAGTIAGWLAQGVNGFYSACIGCWMHGEAATRFGPGLIATDIAAEYPAIHRMLKQPPN